MTRRWIAASGGVLVNGLILGALVLIQEPPPVVEEQSVIVLELERPERQKTSPRRTSAARAGAPSVAARGAPDSSATPQDAAGVAETAPGEPSTPGVDPQWRVDPKAVERWKITEGVPLWGWGRYHRACKGYSSEHMTDEEKDRCYGDWTKPRPGRAAAESKPRGPRVGGPASVPGEPEPVENSEKLWQRRETEPPPWVKEAARQERCRAYRKGGRMPSLLKGGCL